MTKNELQYLRHVYRFRRRYLPKSFDAGLDWLVDQTPELVFRCFPATDDKLANRRWQADHGLSLADHWAAHKRCPTLVNCPF